MAVSLLSELIFFAALKCCHEMYSVILSRRRLRADSSCTEIDVIPFVCVMNR